MQDLDYAMETALREAEELLRERRPSDGAVTARRLDVSKRLRDVAALSSNWRTLAHPNPVLRNRAATLLDRLHGDGDRPGLDLTKADYWAARIEPGTFSMGDDNSKYSYEKPQFTYRIRQPYALGRFPVTNRQYLLFIEALSGRGTPEAIVAARKLLSLMVQHKQTSEQFYPFHWPGASYRTGEGNHPVVGVTWYAATAFAWWANETFLKPEQRVNGKAIRLPTEAEWERSAAYPQSLLDDNPRAGRRVYPWGDGVTEASGGRITSSIEANIDASKIGGTSVVGIFPHGAAGCGAEEMGGNVWEWCSTPKVTYPFKGEVSAESLQTRNSRSGSSYILRGGSWHSSSRYADVRCACRGGYYPFNHDDYYGLRLARLFS